MASVALTYSSRGGAADGRAKGDAGSQRPTARSGVEGTNYTFGRL